MDTQDKCCSIAPYFRIHDGRLASFKDLCERFVEKTMQEPKCLYYGFSFHDDQVRVGRHADELGLRRELAPLPW